MTSSPRRPSRRRIQAAGVGILVGGLALSVAATAAPTAPGAAKGGALTPGQSAALSAGFQIAPKGGAAQARTDQGSANPYIAFVPDLGKADYAGWAERMAAEAAKRTASSAYKTAKKQANRATPAAKAATVWDEQEPAGTSGSNDTPASAEVITTFGTAAGKSNVLRILGENATLPAGSTTALPPVAEDNGSITLAGNSGITGPAATKTTTGVLGDGPHGPSGDGTNDFDVYKVNVGAGLSLVADTSNSPTTTDTILAVYDAAGEVVATDDDGGTTGLSSLVAFTPAAAGTYYVLVGGYSPAGSLPGDPFDSGSGVGGADTGDYGLSLSTRAVDKDNYAVRLRPGDVIGGVGNGAADGLTILRPDGTEAVGAAGIDASSLYPANSPLPGGGNTTLAYVAEEAGLYVLSVDGAVGDYDISLEGYRPGAELDRNKTQTVYLDFEGGRVNTAIWGGPGVRQLSPFSAFLGKWGIPRARESAMINKITNVVRRNIREEVRDGGLNPNLQVDVVNSRTNPEVKGRANTSRIIVSGTIDESGIPTIGIAQFIDPGNYGHEDSALVLLDVLSDPSGPASLNTYLRPRSDRERFVAQAVANVTAHEIGHTVGSFHTDNQSAAVNLMDSGGANFQNLFGVGPDNIGGTADDRNVKFVEDTYSPVEGFTGLEDTKNVTAWAYPRG